MPTEPRKYRLVSETTSGRIHRTIEVQPDSKGEFYRVRVSDVISINTHNDGLLSGEKDETTAQSMLGEAVTGAYKPLEEANAEADAIYDKYITDGWVDATPVGKS